MQSSAHMAIAFLMGVAMSIYLPMNSSVSRYLGSSIAATVTFFAAALLTAALILLLTGEYKAIARIGHVPKYLYLAGFISAFMIVGTTFLIPKIGARAFFILLVAGQILMALIVSHFGILESPRDPITFKKVLAGALVVIGALLSTG